MGFLQGKRILVTGVLSNRSIAYGIAQACRQQGADIALTYVGERFKERVEGFAQELGTDIGLSNFALVGNKIRGDKDREFLKESLPEYRFLGFVPYDDGLIEADLRGIFPEQLQEETRKCFEEIAVNLQSLRTVAASRET